MMETDYFHFCSVLFYRQRSKGSTVVKLKLKGPVNASVSLSALGFGEFCDHHSLSVVFWRMDEGELRTQSQLTAGVGLAYLKM